MRNIALKLMYNGTAYHGWQVQKNAVTVCETLEKALRQVTGERVHLTGCGRTDAGVHAEYYVANFRTDSRIPADRLPFAVNTHTPEDIAVSDAVEVSPDFNAIGSCLRKEYTYRIYNSRIQNPFYVNRACFYPKRLDESLLNRAAGMFVGTHDFRAVRSVGTQTKTTVRTVFWCHVTRRGELLELRVCADGFLYNMVRTIAGTVLYAAEGKFSPENIPAILEGGDRTAAGPVMPPGGLYLTRLWYPDARLSSPDPDVPNVRLNGPDTDVSNARLSSPDADVPDARLNGPDTAADRRTDILNAAAVGQIDGLDTEEGGIWHG